MPKGWHKQPREHGLASKGIKTKKNPNMARLGSQNGRWIDGRSKTYYRRVAGLETNDGKIVHHKDHNKSNSDPSNFEIIEPNDEMTARGIHSQEHPEKGFRDRPRAFARWTDKLRNERGRDWHKWRFTASGVKGMFTYADMQRILIKQKPKYVYAYYDKKYYDKIKFRE